MDEHERMIVLLEAIAFQTSVGIFEKEKYLEGLYAKEGVQQRIPPILAEEKPEKLSNKPNKIQVQSNKRRSCCSS